MSILLENIYNECKNLYEVFGSLKMYYKHYSIIRKSTGRMNVYWIMNTINIEQIIKDNLNL